MKIKNTFFTKMISKFDFEDINLVPKKCVVDSRSECDTSVSLGKFKFKLPVVPANMECVIDEHIATNLASNGYFYIMHRFGLNPIDFIKKMKSQNLVSSISLGVNQDSYETIDEIVLANQVSGSNYTPDFVTIDIAHGHSIKMEKMLKYIKEKLPNTFVIAGNVSTSTAVMELENWGADAVKVGIGPGCFIPTSLVRTKNGLKKLQDINTNDYVLTHKNRFRKVLEKQNYIGEQDLIKINELDPCTETHEFYVVDRSKKDLISESNISDYAFWIQAKYLDKDKHLLVKM